MRPILLVLLACAFFAATNVVARLVAETQAENPIHPLLITFGRYLAGFLLVAPLLATRHAEARSAVPAMYLLRAGGGVISATCIFIGVAHLPVADVTAISYASPFFALLLAALFLGERVRGARWGAVALGFAGALLITRPTPETFQAMALVPFAAALAMGVEVTCARFVAQRDAVGTAMVYTNGGGLLITAAILPFVWAVPTWEQAGLIALIGAITVTGQVLMIAAMREGEASLLAPLFYSTLVYAAVFALLAFGEVPAVWTLGGSALIIASGLWLARSNS
ncbi:MAG: DMT family transporter [Alphaproteobacteria bacterium]|nr:DMT family transporter [Alphaproteobacteria bacterium]MCB9928962.1 DMT family transporter [Alphaproteobacteria bacterium]